MAFLDPNTVIGILESKLGDLVFVRTRSGKVIVRHRPQRTSEFTAAELATQCRLARAAAYVKLVRAQPAVYTLYQQAAKLSGKRACDLAQKDFHQLGINLAGRVRAQALGQAGFDRAGARRFDKDDQLFCGHCAWLP